MLRIGVAVMALTVLAACQPPVPDSGAPAATTQSFEPATPVAAAPLDANPPADNSTAAAAAANSGVAPLQASPSNPAPVALNNPNGISDEQDFDAVSANRTIQSDADLIATNRAQYTVIAPTDLPTRPETGQPNIVEYALRTSNPVGAQLYPRSRLRSNRAAARCAGYQSPDQAQIAFLSQGGPERDRRGLDPDGDGFACAWDPRPFRAARAAAQTAPAPAPTPAPVPAPVAAAGSDAASTETFQPLVISTE